MGSGTSGWLWGGAWASVSLRSSAGVSFVQPGLRATCLSYGWKDEAPTAAQAPGGGLRMLPVSRLSGPRPLAASTGRSWRARAQGQGAGRQRRMRTPGHGGWVTRLSPGDGRGSPPFLIYQLRGPVFLMMVMIKPMEMELKKQDNQD